MKKLKSLMVSAIALVLMGAGSVGAEEVRYSLWAKEGEAQHTAALEFKRVLEAESGGKFTVTVYPGNQLGTPKEMLAQLALNTTQIEASGDPGLKEIENLALPFLMKDMANYLAVLDSDVGREWNARLIDRNRVRLIGILPRSPRQISANKTINSMADLKGLKVRVPARDYYVQSFIAFGAKPTPMAFKEVYTGLQTGIVDGQENPIETIWAMKFFEVQESIAMVDYIKKPAWVKISEAFWQGLSEEEQGWIVTAQRASESKVDELLAEQQKALVTKLQQAGIEITYPDREEFRTATQPVRDSLGKETWGEELYREIARIGQLDM